MRTQEGCYNSSSPVLPCPSLTPPCHTGKMCCCGALLARVASRLRVPCFSLRCVCIPWLPALACGSSCCNDAPGMSATAAAVESFASGLFACVCLCADILHCKGATQGVPVPSIDLLPQRDRFHAGGLLPHCGHQAALPGLPAHVSFRHLCGQLFVSVDG